MQWRTAERFPFRIVKRTSSIAFVQMGPVSGSIGTPPMKVRGFGDRPRQRGCRPPAPTRRDILRQAPVDIREHDQPLRPVARFGAGALTGLQRERRRA
jgi:hypothetical protein